MAENLVINGVTYNNVDRVSIPKTDGTKAEFVTKPTLNITTSGSYNSTTYHGDYWAAVDADGNLLLVVEGGTSSSYESIYFTVSSVPAGVSLVNQSYYSYASMTTGMAYVAVFSGVTGSVSVALNFSGRDGTSDYVTCSVTITSV